MLHLKAVGGTKTLVGHGMFLISDNPYEWIGCEIFSNFFSPPHIIYIIVFLIVLNVNEVLIQFSHGINSKDDIKE